MKMLLLLCSPPVAPPKKKATLAPPLSVEFVFRHASSVSKGLQEENKSRECAARGAAWDLEQMSSGAF